MSRGRGRGQLSFNADALGLTPRDMPAAVLAPPPKYPARENRIMPLVQGEQQVRGKNKLCTVFRTLQIT